MEALAAVTLIALAFLPLLTLQSQLIRTTIAIERAEEKVRVQSNALAYLRSVNPVLRGAGEENLGLATLKWTSRPLTQPRPPVSMSGEIGRYNIQLFEIDAVLEFQDRRVIPITVRQLGWVATREPFSS